MKCLNCNLEYDHERFPVCPYCLTPFESIDSNEEMSLDEEVSCEADSYDVSASNEGELLADLIPESMDESLSAKDDPVLSMDSDKKSESHPRADIYIVEIPEMSNRCKNALLRNGIKTLHDLKTSIESDEIYNFKSVGMGIINEAKSFIDYQPAICYSDRIPLTRYFNPRYRLFLSYCSENGIQFVDQLCEIDIEELQFISGLGVKKINEIVNLINSLKSDGLISEDLTTGSDHIDSSPILFTSVDVQLQNIDLNIIEHLGATKDVAKKLRFRGMRKIGDLCNITERRIANIVGTENLQLFRDLEEILSGSLQSVIGLFLDEQAPSMDFNIILKRSEGYTLQEIADDHTVTRERIRQRESKYLHQLDDYLIPLIDSFIVDKGYVTVQDVLDIYDNDDYDKVLIYWCNKSDYLNNLNFADLYLPKSVNVDEVYSKLNGLVEDFIDDGARISDFRDDVEEKLNEFGFYFLNIDSFISFLLTAGYKRYNDYIVLRSTTYGYLCARLIAKHYPNGFKLHDHNELDQLRGYADQEFGSIGIPDSDRAMSSRIFDYTVLSGRGMVTAPENIQIDLEMLEDIKAYIDSQPSSEIYYSDLFGLFEGLITMRSNIDNYNFLHGVLKFYYKNEYDFSRDYLTKRGDNLLSGKTTDRIKSLISEKGRPVSKKEIIAKWPGITTIVLANALLDKSLFLWETQQYYSIDMLVLDENSREELKMTIDRTLEQHNGYCSAGLLYSVIMDVCPNFITDNNIQNASNLFYTCAKLFEEYYDFRNPHLCQKALIPELSMINVIKYLLNDPKEIDYTIVKSLASEYSWSHVTISFLFYDLSADYVRVSDTGYVKNTDFYIGDTAVDIIRNYILEHKKFDCFSLLNYDCFDELPDVGYSWNVFLLRSIIEKYMSSFRIVEPKAKDRRYERGIVVDSISDMFDYIDVVVHTIKCNGTNEISESNLLSLLVLNDLSYKIIPQELYVDNERLLYKDGLFTVLDG